MKAVFMIMHIFICAANYLLKVFCKLFLKVTLGSPSNFLPRLVIVNKT